jgi:hypothetical protein
MPDGVHPTGGQACPVGREFATCDAGFAADSGRFELVAVVHSTKGGTRSSR